MKKIRLITAAFGSDGTELKINAPLSDHNYLVDVVYYNNLNTPSRKNSLHPRMKGKIPKMMEWLEHPDYDYYIWVDSLFTIENGFLENMLEGVDDTADLYLFAHGKRASIREEMEYVNKRIAEGSDYLRMRYDGEGMNAQVSHYLADLSFKDDHLFMGGCFLYTKPLVADRNGNMMMDWFAHNALYSIQDQLSLPYLIHKHGVKYKVYPHALMKNDFLVHKWSIFQ